MYRSLRHALLGLLVAASVSTAVAQAPVGRTVDAAQLATRPETTTTVRRSLEMDDLLNWKSIRSSTVSNDGKWFAYQLAPNEGDSEVILRRTSDDKEIRFQVGENANPGLAISDNSQ